MEGGNNLEQATALVAAANRVVQDPSSVGSALRTISLRLRGTSVEVLEEMGEETDGVVESVSKMQEKIKALSGIDILTDAGDYKDTYTILKEIGNVWEEMSDIDQAALLELMAGKNRANTLSAILSNMEDLEGAYESALGAEGSALKENATYLDSIQGRIDIFKNSTQTMWMNFLDTDVVKFIVDLGTALINAADSMGLLTTAAGGYTAVKSAISSVKEELEYLKDTGHTSKGLFGFGEFSKEADVAKTAAKEVGKAVGDMDDVFDQVNEAIEDNINVTDDATASAIRHATGKNVEQAAIKSSQVATGIENIQKDINITKTWGQVAAEKALAVAKGIAKGLLIGAATALATVALTKLVEVIWNAAHRVENLKKEVTELKDAYEEAKETFDDNLETLATPSDTKLYATLEEEFAHLTKGVDRYGNNISLTADEYERYRDICEEIVSIQPHIASGYDSATEAIGNNASVLSELIELQKIQARQNAYNFVSDENMEKMAEDAINDYKAAQQKIFNYLNGNVDTSLATKMYAAYDWYDGSEQHTTDYGDKNSDGDDLAKKILEDIGFSPEEIEEELSKYYKGSYFQYTQFIEGIADQIAANASVLPNEIKNWASEYKTAQQSLQTAQDGMIDTLLQVPMSLEEYDDFSSAERSFMTSWIKNNDMFKIDSDEIEADTILSWKQTIQQMVRNLSDLTGSYTLDNDTVISAQDILNTVYNLDPSTMDWGQYNQMVNDLLGYFWEAIGEGGREKLGLKGSKDEGIIDLMSMMFGRDFASEAAAKDKMATTLSKIKGWTYTEAIEYLDSLPALKYQGLLEVDWDVVTNEEELNNVLNGTAVSDISSVQTYSTISAGVDAYNEVLTQTSEIVSDNTEVTQEYKDSLTELGFSAEELAECFDKDNKLIVTNSTLLRKLVAEKKKAQQATIQEAKAYGQLQYTNTAKKLQQYISSMAAEVKAHGYVSSATVQTIDAMRSQLSILQETIKQYTLLELKLTDAANAYTEFELAQQKDSELSYGDSMIEMLQVINDGFKTGKVGSEAFQAAVQALVPESVYKDIDNVQDRMQAIHDYIDKNPIFADYFTIDDDGNFSITMDNIEAFLQDGLNDGLGENFGVFTGTVEDFDLAPHIKSVKDLADAYGITEAAALAMITEFTKYDASWGDILTELTTTELDREINNATTALDEALIAQEEFIRSGGDLNSDEYKQLVENVDNARGALDTATQAAIDNAQANAQVNTIIKAMQGECELAEGQLNEIARFLGIIGDNETLTFNAETGALELTQTQLDRLNERLTGLKEPTIMDVQLAYDNIDAQLEELSKYISDPANYKGTIHTELNIDNKQEAEDMYAKLTADQQAISLVYNITSTSTDQDDGNMEQLATWETNGINITIKGDTTSFDQAVADANAVEMDEKPVEITADPTQANLDIDSVDNNHIDDKTPKISMQGTYTALSEITSIGDALDQLPGTITITVKTKSQVVETGSGGEYADGASVNGNFHLSGGAFANGTIGAPKDETALVGELGPEMLVRNGRWMTVGENGAEFTQVKKGDIIFNHKQTKDLLSKGYVTGRGKAYADGTAYGYGIYKDYVGDDDVFANGSDKWIDPLNNAADSLSGAADDISDAADEFEEVFDWIEVRLEEITTQLDYQAARLENTNGIENRHDIINEMIEGQRVLYENLMAGAQRYYTEADKYLAQIPEEYREMAKNGAISIEEFEGKVDEETLELIKKYREWGQKGDDARKRAEEALTEIRRLADEAFNTIIDHYENERSINQGQVNQNEAYQDYLETTMGSPSEAGYQEMIRQRNNEIALMEQQKADMQAELNRQVAAGEIKVGDPEWYERINAIADLDTEIIKARTEVANWQDDMNKIRWDNFDNLMDRISAISDEAENLISILSEKDLFTDNGEWTDEGITTLGLYAQQMEAAEYAAKKYQEEIDYLNENWQALGMTEEEYRERLKMLKDGQYDAIKAYQDSKKAIVEENKARVEAIKDGIDKEIEAFDELISKKKEELDAEKD